MTPPDTQHLDFLLSQHVDDVLDPGHRRAVLGELAANPVAKKLLAEHRDVQDMLDEWGSRLPLIDWAQFDQTLQLRLDEITAAPARVQPRWTRWLRPASIAAGLLLAAAIGLGIYAHDHAAQPANGPTVAVNTAQTGPLAQVNIGNPAALTRPALARVSFPESAPLLTQTADATVTAPDTSDGTSAKPDGVAFVNTPVAAPGSVAGGSDNTPPAPIDPLTNTR